MKEFQALGLDISIINDEGETLQLKEIEEAEDKEDMNTSIDEVESPAVEITANNDEEEFEEDDEFEDEDDFDDEFDESEVDFDEEFEEGADL